MTSAGSWSTASVKRSPRALAARPASLEESRNVTWRLLGGELDAVEVGGDGEHDDGAALGRQQRRGCRRRDRRVAERDAHEQGTQQNARRRHGAGGGVEAGEVPGESLAA